MIEVRKQSKDENLMHGDSFPITVCIGNTCKYLTIRAFEELKTKLNTFAIPNVVVPKDTFYCKNNQGNGREEMRCQKQCKHCLEC